MTGDGDVCSAPSTRTDVVSPPPACPVFSALYLMPEVSWDVMKMFKKVYNTDESV